MNELLSQYYFAKPVFLWLLTGLPLLWLRLRGGSLPFIAWRTLVLAVLILALADPQTVAERTEITERVFAFDLSQSVPSDMRRWMERITESDFSPTSKDRVFVFGSEAREVENWRAWLRGEVSPAPIQPNKTSLEKLFNALTGLPAAPRTLFLFTDGWETEGDVERLLSSIALSGLKVFPQLPAERPHVANVAVRRLLAPGQANSGEAANLKVILENQNERSVDGTLTLTRNGQSLKNDAIRLQPGSQILTYPVTIPEGQSVSFRVTFTPRQKTLDLHPADNQAVAWVAVRTKDKVLLLSGRSGGGRYLEEILKRQGFEVTSWHPGSSSPPSPVGYGVVIFNNVERENLTASYLAAMERHVNQGGGFLMLGGEASFGFDGYRRTPIETILPVEFKEPKREQKNRAVIVIIDKSGSMRQENRLLYAQEAAKAVTNQLEDQDLLGVVGFDVSPFVVVPLSPVGNMRGTVAGQIDRLKPGGKTYLYPAVLEAKRQLERQTAAKKHVIILSDGETGGSGGDYIDLVYVMKEELKITVSTIAIGDEANIPLMKRIAQYGGGLFHHTYDPRTLPRIALQQIQEKPKEEPMIDQDFVPLAADRSELLAGFKVRRYPPLKGFMETELKRRAQLDLQIPRSGRSSPLLASWNYGAGKVAAFTSDLEGRWSRNWIQWDGLQKFWDTVLSWLRPPKESLPPHEARVDLVGKAAILDLYLYEEPNGSSQFRYSVSGQGKPGDGFLKKLAPGHYQTALPISVPGDYRIELTEERGGRRFSYPPIGYTLPYNPNSEIPRPEFNVRLLEQLARATGGQINPQSAEALRSAEVIRNFSPQRPILVMLVAALFLLEVIARRAFLGNPS